MACSTLKLFATIEIYLTLPWKTGWHLYIQHVDIRVNPIMINMTISDRQIQTLSHKKLCGLPVITQQAGSSHSKYISRKA